VWDDGIGRQISKVVRSFQIRQSFLMGIPEPDVTLYNRSSEQTPAHMEIGS